MEYRVSMAEAAQMLLRSRKAPTIEFARKALIAALMREEFVAICEAYWRRSVPPIDNTEKELFEHAPYDAGVPADFWRMEHAQDFSSDNEGCPSGAWGSWSKSNFHTELELTGATAALRWVDFRDLADQGSKPVSIFFDAMEVSVGRTDIERLIERGNFQRIIRKASDISPVRLGNISKSDRDDIIARLCAVLICEVEEDPQDLDHKDVLRILYSLSSDTSAEIAVGEKSLRGFAHKVVDQIFNELSIQSINPPR